MDIKGVILTISLVACLALGISSMLFYKKSKDIETKLEISKNNEKAFISENDSLKDKNVQFNLTIKQLKHYNDSLSIKLNGVLKQLKIKDNEVKNLQYLLTKASVKDSIFIRDTIFKEVNFALDTSITNPWYDIKMNLSYPNKIIIEPTFTSEKYIVSNTKKVTVDPPYKCFIGRLFQKKQTIIEVQVVEKSPYVITEEQRFIEIIK